MPACLLQRAPPALNLPRPQPGLPVHTQTSMAARPSRATVWPTATRCARTRRHPTPGTRAAASLATPGAAPPATATPPTTLRSLAARCVPARLWLGSHSSAAPQSTPAHPVAEAALRSLACGAACCLARRHLGCSTHTCRPCPLPPLTRPQCQCKGGHHASADGRTCVPNCALSQDCPEEAPICNVATGVCQPCQNNGDKGLQCAVRAAQLGNTLIQCECLRWPALARPPRMCCAPHARQRSSAVAPARWCAGT